MLSALELLAAWERGRGATTIERALLLLAAADPEADTGGLAKLPIGARDARLLRLRAELFGDTLECVARCPECDAAVDVAVAAADLLAAQDAVGDVAVRWLDVDGYRVRFHLPSSADLMAAVSGTAPEVARVALFDRCVEGVAAPNGAGAAAALSTTAVAAVVAEMEAADPLGDPTLDLLCPECAVRWAAPLDVIAFLWTEIDAWARRTLREVHALAREYGWSEAEILALSPARRRAYLELTGD